MLNTVKKMVVLVVAVMMSFANNLIGSEGVGDRVLHLQKGWNMVSVPIDLSDSTVSAVFGDKITQPVWGWDAKEVGYYQATNVKAVSGYWVYATESFAVVFSADGSVTEVPSAGLRVEASSWSLVSTIVGNSQAVTLGEMTLVVKERDVKLTRLPVLVEGENLPGLGNFQLIAEDGQVLDQDRDCVDGWVVFENDHLVSLSVGMHNIRVVADIAATIAGESQIDLFVYPPEVMAKCLEYGRDVVVTPQTSLAIGHRTVVQNGNLLVEVNPEADLYSRAIRGSEVVLGSWAVTAEHEDVLVTTLALRSNPGVDSVADGFETRTFDYLLYFDLWDVTDGSEHAFEVGVSPDFYTSWEFFNFIL